MKRSLRHCSHLRCHLFVKHVRFSNTEPIVRVIGEAVRREDAQAAVSEVAAYFGW